MSARLRRYTITIAAAAVVLAPTIAAAGPATATPTPTPKACAVPSPVAHSRAPGTKKSVALTFDDGPGPSTTAILRILETAKVRASFFNIGEQLAGGAAALRREVRDGDVLGNHTWSHPDMLRLSTAAQQRQLDRTSTMQRRLTGTIPCVFRPPYEDFDTATMRIAASRHEATWLWSVDTEDWKAEGSDATWWVDRIVARAEAGGAQQHPVILMHNMAGRGNPATVRALARIVGFYKSHGYRFVTVDDPSH